MHNSKLRSDLFKKEAGKRDKYEVETNSIKNLKQHDIENHIETTTTATSCTFSTDSGMNMINDNDKIPPSSPTISHMQLFLSSIPTYDALSTWDAKHHKNNEQGGQDNNKNMIKANICTVNNNNKNYNGKDDIDHDSENKNIYSKIFDSTLKKEEGINRDNNSRHRQNQNIIKEKYSINASQQQIPTALTSTLTYKDKTSLKHKKLFNQQRRTMSTSSLSISSNSTGYDDNYSSKNRQSSASPVVSIRSISSTIITSDSDLDLNNDNEDCDKNYVIKKLGTQVTFSPNDSNIPNLSSGHTILNQKVIPNDNQVLPPPLAALATIGDSIGAAHALGSAPAVLAVQRPQIGSIALSNSSDVTFGDKHFYEGPVTIQQFLIDSQNKWTDFNGEENPTFVNECFEAHTNKTKEIKSSPEGNLYEHIVKRKKCIIPAILALVAMLIVATILGSKTLYDSRSKLVFGNSEESRYVIPINSTIDRNKNEVDNGNECNSNYKLCLIDRDVWRANPPKGTLDKQVLPLHRAIISHTASEPCGSIKVCAEHVRVIQEFHMNSLGWDDIGYNFLISSGGLIYVGRGWDFVGAHTKGYNYDSVGITFIGTYISTPPTEVQLNACISLLAEGLRLKKLAPDYRLYGARQFGATESPGEMLYKKIKRWQHWSMNINFT